MTPAPAEPNAPRAKRRGETPRGALRRELTTRLVPELLARGFEGPRAIAGNAILHEYLRRQGDVDQRLWVQLEKWGRPRFVLRMEVPPFNLEPPTPPRGEFLHGSLQPRRGYDTRSWFCADPPLWRRLLLRDRTRHHVEAVSQCIALLPELDAWWERLTESEHISQFVQRFDPPG